MFEGRSGRFVLPWNWILQSNLWHIVELGHTESIDTLGFTKLNWHEKLIALAESFKNAETKRNVVDSVADDLFESKRIDELISHLEKHAPIGVHQKPHQSRFNRLIRYAWVADKLYYSDR